MKETWLPVYVSTYFLLMTEVNLFHTMLYLIWHDGEIVFGADLPGNSEKNTFLMNNQHWASITGLI